MSGKTLKLLLVDDEPQTREVLRQIFRMKGHDVRTAEDGFAALRTIDERKPDVLVSDLNMPGMSGFELLSVVRRRLPDIYVIATSGAYTGDVVPEGIAADAFHPKATKLQGLTRLVEDAALAAKPLRRARGDAAPIWISGSQDLETGAVSAMISCPQCLRALPQVLIDERRSIRTTACVYCQAPVEFAVVEPLDPRKFQPLTA